MYPGSFDQVGYRHSQVNFKHLPSPSPELSMPSLIQQIHLNLVVLTIT
jgi:hypothetical protein